MSLRRRLPVLALVGATGCVVPTNPFDPDAPTDLQARATVSGQVRAIFARDDNGEPGAPGACDVVEGVGNDGFRVVLRGVRSGGAGISALSAETNETGLFRFEGVPPGDYTLEVIAAGFATPPAAELSVGPGEDRALGAFCAINASGPPAPTLAPLPDLLQSSDGPVVVDIVDREAACDAATGCAVAWEVTQHRDGEAAITTVIDRDDDDVAVVLVAADAAIARTAIRIAAVAIDALGNRSVASEDVIVVDDRPPAPPTLLPAIVGRDRITIRFEQAAATDVDDAPASWLVFYGLLPRGDDDTDDAVRDDCPFGRPRFDDTGAVVDENGRARFALEGTSPLSTTTTTQTLSGIAAGTDVVVHVAAIDAAGNAGCYSAPQISRPDVVVLSADLRRSAEGAGTAGAARGAVIDGVVDGTIALARASGGLSIIGSDDVVVVDPTPTFDVVAHGRSFVTAVGAAGVRIVPIDDAGRAVTADIVTIDVGGTVDAVAVRPGIVVAGTTTGISIVDVATEVASAIVDPGNRGAVADVASFGELLVLRRTSGLQVVERAPPHAEVGFVAFAGAANDLLIHDDAAVVALGGEGVAVFELAGCPGADCLRARARRALPRSGNAVSVAVVDELIAVGVVESGGDNVIVTVDPRAALSIVGRSVVDALPVVLVSEPGLVCSLGGGRAADCVTPFNGPLSDSERRLQTVGDVKRTRVAGAHAIAFEEAGTRGEVGFVVRAPLATMVPSSRAIIPGIIGDLRILDPIGGVVLDDDRVLVVDGIARVFVVSPGASTATLVSDLGPALLTALPALGDTADVDNGTFSGFVDRVGDALLIGLFNSDGDAGFVRVTLGEDISGALVVDDVEALALPAVDQFTNLVVRGGQAFVPSIPFGLFVVDLGGALGLDDTSLELADGGNIDDLAFVAIDGESTTGVLIGTRDDGVSGLFDLTGTVGFPVPAEVASANALVGLHRFAVASSRDQGLVTILGDVDGGAVAFVPLLEVPSASQTEDTRPSVRGLLVADSAGGVLRVVLR